MMEFTLEDYKKASKIAAQLVKKFGDQYLPIFKRAFEELKNAEANATLKLIALDLANQ